MDDSGGDMVVGKWNFIAVSILFENLQYYFVDLYVNTKHSSTFTIEKSVYTGTLTNKKFELGSVNNNHSDVYYIKHFGIDSGGSIKAYDTGGYTD